MKILIIDDEQSVLFALNELLTNEGFQAMTASSGEEALARLESEAIAIAIIDYHLPGLNGLELLGIIKEKFNWVQVIMITAYGSEKIAIDAIKKGAYDYISKPFSNEALLNRIRHINDHKINTEEIQNSKFGYYYSSIMNKKIEKIKTIARTNVPVLITGESGTGKELIANLCHEYSHRKGNFISVNCSALPQSLIESELFGAEKGAYTGSLNKKIGFFELAHNGTIFLDEIGELPFEMQAKFLRVLQDGELTRLGSGLPIKINARVIAATNKDLEKEIKENNFREDLFFRLNVLHLTIPPLRFRKEEITPLSLMFLKNFNQNYHKNIAGFEADALQEMNQYSWPGNIRELKNKIEKAVLLCQSQWIGLADLSLNSHQKSKIIPDEPIAARHAPPALENNPGGKPYFNIPDLPPKIVQAKKEITQQFEREFILYYLNKNDWNVKKTAENIGLCRQDLYKKMKKLSIQKEIKYT